MKRIFGGSWYVGSRLARVAYRVRDAPDARRNYLGLRLAQSPVQRMAKEEPPPRKS